MLDAVSLVHMNGRVYDPQLGRFLSADPIVQTINVSQAINPFSYVMNNPLTLTDPSGYSWLSKIFHAIGNFLQKYWRPIVAIIVAVVAYYVAAPYLSSAFYSSSTLGTATVSSAYGTTTVTLTSVYATGTITTAGAVAGGAIAGALAGAITGGWKGALSGAIAGGLFGAIGGYYGDTWSAARVGASGIAGGSTSVVQGQSFWRGFEIGVGIAFLQWAASSMRQSMIRQSLRIKSNSSGDSYGVDEDGFKLGGGRIPEGMNNIPNGVGSPLGGWQGGIGRLPLFGPYSPGSWGDLLVEAYAGPHDWLSKMWYTAQGAFENIPRWAEIPFWMHSVVNLVVATPFVDSQAAPGLAFSDER